MFKGNFNYNVVNNFVDEIAKVLYARGFAVIVIPITNDEKMSQEIIAAFEFPVYFTVGFNGIGSDLRVDGKSLFDVYNTIFIHWLVDHPAAHFARIEQPISKSIVTCIDDAHCDYMEKYYPNKIVTFIEHATSMEEQLKEKKYNIVFAGGLEDIESITQQIQPLLNLIPNLLSDIINYSNESNFDLDEFKEYCLTKHAILHDIFMQNRVNIFAFLTLVDRYYRAYKREKILLKLLEENYVVDYFGKLPENSLLINYHNFQLHKEVEYNDLTSVFLQSKVVLNVFPNFIKGGHERIFKAMACGAIILTDSNEYIIQHFTEGFIEVSAESLDGEKLNRVLTDDTYRESIVEKNTVKIKSHHLWDNRVDKLLYTVEEAKKYM